MLYFIGNPFPFRFAFSPDFVIHIHFLPCPFLCSFPSPHPPAHLQWCCAVSGDKAGVLLYNEFCIHVYEMVRSAKGSMFVKVYIVKSYVGGGGEWLQL